MESVVMVIGAFFLFLAGLPLLGAAAVFTLRVLVPYLFGGVLVYLVMLNQFAATGVWYELATPLACWAALVLGTRLLDSRPHAWHEGHWRAVFIVVSFGLWHRTRLPAESFKVYEYRLAVDAD